MTSRVIVVAALVLAAAAATPVSALDVGPASPIVSGTSAKEYLEISGDVAVWMDDRVYLGLAVYDFTTHTEALLDVIGRFPSIDGTRIAYSAGDSYGIGTYAIWLYDLSTGTSTQITAGGFHSRGDISGSWVGYVDNPPDPPGSPITLYAKNIVSGVTVTLPTLQAKAFPKMDGDWAVYEDNRSGNYDVYAYDLSTMTETRITTDSKNEAVSDVSGGRIVFERSRDDGTVDIYAYDLSTGITLPVSVGRGALGSWRGPRISGGLVVHQAQRKNARSNEIFLHDLATSSEIQVTNNTTWESWATVSGNRIMWVTQDGSILVAPVQ